MYYIFLQPINKKKSKKKNNNRKMSTNTIPENVHLPRKPEPPKFLFNGYVQAPVSVEGKFLYNTAIFGSFGALVGLSKFYYTPHRTLQYHESATAMNMLKKYYSVLFFFVVQIINYINK